MNKGAILFSKKQIMKAMLSVQTRNNINITNMSMVHSNTPLIHSHRHQFTIELSDWSAIME